MQLLSILPLWVLLARTASAAGKTHIYIDQVPLYTSLQPCVQDRLSAIVRAQASGCGDDTQLTSFACFCIDSSTEYASIISTAVEDQCQTTATQVARRDEVLLTTDAAQAKATARRIRARAPQAATTTDANVQSALAAFSSYCAKSTELSRFDQQNSVTMTTPPPQTVYLTPSSSSSSSASSSGGNSRGTALIVAIVIPSVLIPISAAVALLFYLRYRRLNSQLSQVQAEKDAMTASSSTGGFRELSGARRPELFGDQRQRIEMESRYKHMTQVQELENPAVELDGGAMFYEKRELDKGKTGWI